MACCQLVGNQIGAGNVHKAKRYFRISTYFTICVMVAEFIILFYFRDEAIKIFSQNPDVIAISNDIIWIVLIVIAQDFL